MKRNIVIIATQKQQKERKKMKGKERKAPVGECEADMAWHSTPCSVADGTVWKSDCTGVWHLIREQAGGAVLNKVWEVWEGVGGVWGGVGCRFRVGYCTMRDIHHPQRWKDEARAGGRVYCLHQTDISLQMISQSVNSRQDCLWQDSHWTFALCVFSVTVWFQTSKIAQTQMVFL